MKKDYFLRSAMGNFSNTNNTADLLEQHQDYYRGIVNGLISVLMDNYQVNQFEKAVKRLCENLPSDHIAMVDIIPECWQDEFSNHVNIYMSVTLN